MRRPSVLIVLAATVLLSAVLFTAPAAKASFTGGGAARAGDYVGSGSCESCHEPEYQSWRRNLHVQMTKPIADAHIVGDFKAGTEFQDHGRAYTMETRDGRYFISIAEGGRPAEKFEVNYTLGARRFQGYLSTLPDGRIYVLPVFWHNETGRWIDYEEITPVPKDPAHTFRQIWNVTCVNCHATNLERNFSVATNTFATTWTEMGIGCEACHGPGRAHIDDPDHLNIFTMKKVAPRQIFDTCGYCHGNKNNLFFGFRAGDRYDDFALPFFISEPIPDNDPQGEFWPDGRPSRFNRPQALTLTGCFQRGEATCTSCHRMHGAESNHSLKASIDAPGGGHTRESDTLCTQCHSEASGSSGSGGSDGSRGSDGSSRYGAEHTHHAPESQGSRCITCHMSDVNWRLITRRLDHTFQPPVPEMTARFGAPNACTTCHEDKSPEWAAATMDRWYGNGERRRAVVAVADTMYRAGTGDTSVLPDVARLAVSRSHGALVRASAAEFAGQLIARSRESAGSRGSRGSDGSSGSDGSRGSDGSDGSGGRVAQGFSPAILNALIGAANDAEPWVRITAVRALGMTRDAQMAPMLAAHLVDNSRLARVAAAEALMRVGISHLEGAPGAALRSAQDEWAQSLRTFNDDANDHATLGWLEAARGRIDAAVGELNAAIKLDPARARPHAYLGMLAARVGRYEEAVQHFKTAKALEPAYPNIDRLIEEARKRR